MSSWVRLRAGRHSSFLRASRNNVARCLVEPLHPLDAHVRRFFSLSRSPSLAATRRRAFLSFFTRHTYRPLRSSLLFRRCIAPDAHSLAFTTARFAEENAKRACVRACTYHAPVNARKLESHAARLRLVALGHVRGTLDLEHMKVYFLGWTDRVEQSREISLRKGFSRALHVTREFSDAQNNV